MKTIHMTMAQALIQFLNQQYVEFDGVEQKFVKGIFTLFGHGNVLGVGQALEQDPGDLAIYQGKNEQGMAHAAMAFAKQKLRKQIFACTSSVGPGAANMIAAAATATANNIPVLFLPGDVYASRQPDPVLQQIEQTSDLSISTNDAFRAVSKYWDRVQRPEQLMTAMINAMRVLTDAGDTGAVTIALPQDVQAESYDFPAYFFTKRVHRIERTLPTEPMINEAVACIKEAKKPMIICGGGVRYAEAWDTLQAFCEEFHIPFGETQAGKSALPYDFPYNLGGVGVTGGLAANQIAKEADVIIGIGTRFTDFTTGSKWLFQHPQVRFVNVNVSPFHANKLDGIKIVADAKVGMEALAAALRAEGYRSAYTEELSQAKQAWQREMNRLFAATYTTADKPEIAGHLDEQLSDYVEALGTTLTQTGVLGALQQLLDDDAVVVGSSGSLPGCMQRIWLPKIRNTYHMEYGYSCMGYEISGAMGVKLAEPHAEVYAMVGDGSFLMLHSELITSLQQNTKINVVLLDNGGFGCINNLQMGSGMGSFGTEFRMGNTPEGAVMCIDYAKVAEGYGAKSYSIHSLEELEQAVLDAKTQTKSVLFDIKVLPKTMTSGYDAWWNTGVASVSKKESIADSFAEKMKHFEQARKY